MGHASGNKMLRKSKYLLVYIYISFNKDKSTDEDFHVDMSLLKKLLSVLLTHYK